MTDIVERLRIYGNTASYGSDLREAADEIERLREYEREHPYSEIDMDMHVEAITAKLKAESIRD